MDPKVLKTFLWDLDEHKAFKKDVYLQRLTYLLSAHLKCII